MDYLRNENLFFSKYVIGCELPNNTNIDCIKTLHNWLYFKDNDYGMSRYRTDKTQYIAFLNIIDLSVLKEIINDLIIIYKKEYPFGEKSDFIEQIFSYTLYSLELFVGYENYTWYGTPPNIENEVYYKFTRGENEYIEFVTEPDKNIEYYQQYYKKVIAMINNLDFDASQIKSKEQVQKESLQNTRDKLFEINKKNYLELVNEYSFSEKEGLFIQRNFWPIIVVNSFNTEWIKNELDCNKIEFIKANKIFNLDIFKRNELDLLIDELNEYLENLSKGKTKIWAKQKEHYFHWFKLELDTKSYTLIVSDKNEIQLEIYFKYLLSEILKFIENEQTLPFQPVESKLEHVNNEKVFSLQQIQQQSIKDALTKLKSINTIDIEKIIEIGFIKAFIEEYYEYKIHSHYPDKDRLLYAMCNSEAEKVKITAKKIKQTRLKIKKLGNEDLSFAYLLSCKPELTMSFIEPNERFNFWLSKFCEKFIDNIISFAPIFYACELISNNQSIDFIEDEFWSIYPESEKPKESSLHFILECEAELLFEIENIIDDFVKNEYWEFDFNELIKYTDVSKPIEFLFNISELLVQLHRLEMFNEFMLPRQKVETKMHKITALVLGLFCGLVNKLGIDKKGERESAEVYCKRICGRYELSYTDRVRQNYNVNETNNLRTQLIEKVLPLIDKESQNVIQKYLDSKQPPKQNLYV